VRSALRISYLTPACRDTSRAIELLLHRVTVRAVLLPIHISYIDLTPSQGLLDLLPDKSTQLAISVGDFEIIDHVSTSSIRRLLGYWVNEAIHPRETDTAMLRLALDTSAFEESALRVAVLPLRVNLDQDALDLLR